MYFCLGKIVIFIFILFMFWMFICVFKIFRKMNIIINIEVCVSIIFFDFMVFNLIFICSCLFYVFDDLR